MNAIDIAFAHVEINLLNKLCYILFHEFVNIYSHCATAVHLHHHLIQYLQSLLVTINWIRSGKYSLSEIIQ